MTEEWKDIAGYEGKYQVSNLGRVCSLDMEFDRIWKGITQRYHVKGRLLKQKIDRKGYMFVGLSNGKRHKTSYFRVHQLVARAFIPNPKSLPMINHKDEDKTNNCIWNLEWCNVQYNNTYGTIPQRNSEAHSVAIVQCDLEQNPIQTFKSLTEAATYIGLTKYAISKCLTGKNKTAGGYKWKYLNYNDNESNETL